MAPESERANVKCEFCKDDGILVVARPCIACDAGKRLARPQNEPTLTCSEVVERLAKCVQPNILCPRQELDRTKAAAILHSWRERLLLPNSSCCSAQVYWEGGTCSKCGTVVNMDGHRSVR